MSGARSDPWHSRPMATTSSQARTIEQFVCGMPRRVRRWHALSLDTRIQSGLWHSRLMVTTSSQARTIEQFVCGMPRRERQWQALSLDTQIGSTLWHSHQMATTLSRARRIEQFECQMLQNGIQKLKMMSAFLITPWSIARDGCVVVKVN